MKTGVVEKLNGGLTLLYGDRSCTHPWRVVTPPEDYDGMYVTAQGGSTNELYRGVACFRSREEAEEAAALYLLKHGGED